MRKHTIQGWGDHDDPRGPGREEISTRDATFDLAPREAIVAICNKAYASRAFETRFVVHQYSGEIKARIIVRLLRGRNVSKSEPSFLIQSIVILLQPLFQVVAAQWVEKVSLRHPQGRDH